MFSVSAERSVEIEKQLQPCQQSSHGSTNRFGSRSRDRHPFSDAAGVADAAAARLEARRAPYVRNRRDFKFSPVFPEDALRMHYARFVGRQFHRDIDFHETIPPAAQKRIV